MPLGLVIVGGFFVFALFAVGLTYFVFKYAGKAWGWTVVVILLLPFFDAILGRLQWHYLCASHAGHTITRTELADGFFDGGSHTGCTDRCVTALTAQSFSFVEMDVATPAWITREKGLQRFYLTSAPSPLCIDYDRQIQRYPLTAPRMPHGQCVAHSPISEISSQYEVIDGQRELVPYSAVKLERVTSHIRDRRSNELLAQATSFWYWGGWLAKASGLSQTAEVCPTNWAEARRAVRSVLRSQSGTR